METPAPPPGPTKAETLNGSLILDVRRRDGSTIRVKVRQLSVRDLTRYTADLGDPAALAELLCNEKRGWADTLANESVFKIVEEGERVNADPFGEFMAFQRGRADRLRSALPPGVIESSPTLSPKSASSPE